MADRTSGILLHVSSLPSPYGIGTLGKAAYAFADFLAAAGQTYWQVLPMGPTSYGDSPYQSFSTFAGNPYFIDLELLAQDGLLTPDELPEELEGERYVDFGRLYETRYTILRKAFNRGWKRDKGKVNAFAASRTWLHDHALFMALKDHFDNKSWLEWPDEDIRLREEGAMKHYAALLQEEMQFHIYLQYLFFRQWDALRQYAHSLGVQIIGDIPIYVALDSADVWSEPAFFQLDERNIPTEVAGVPPDYFSADGQLWGNPLYDYEKMAADGYRWWIRRMSGAARLYDVVRIDHFRGFESYWAVPYGDKTAAGGRWRKGPGMDLVRLLIEQSGHMKIIAEDLGFLTPEVHELLAQSGLPGMKVLEFAFDPREPSNYLPHTYPTHCVCYVGTHDNETVMEWRAGAAQEDVAFAEKYLGLHEAEGFHWGMIRGGQSSVAELFIAQMQDYLGLGPEGRMNKPGTAKGNWRWRLLPGEIGPELTERIYQMTWMYGRCKRRP